MCAVGGAGIIGGTGAAGGRAQATITTTPAGTGAGARSIGVGVGVAGGGNHGFRAARLRRVALIVAEGGRGGLPRALP